MIRWEKSSAESNTVATIKRNTYVLSYSAQLQYVIQYTPNEI